ncbi:MAG: sigma-70 family RNA polymerase sigma factor [Armatimonadetes bacterium]|nr:sigma-70 family RNA polymerase sigma factor [Armatimonadota bacterium]
MVQSEISNTEYCWKLIIDSKWNHEICGQDPCEFLAAKILELARPIVRKFSWHGISVDFELEAKDLTTEVYARLVETRVAVKSSLSGLICAMVLNQLYRPNRFLAREVELNIWLPYPRDDFGPAELHAILSSRLTKEQMRIVQLYLVEQRTMDEVAGELGIPKRAARSRIEQVRNEIMRIVLPEEDQS